MNKLTLFVLTAALSVTTCLQAKNFAESEFKPLFDGKTLNGWKQFEKHGVGYIVENGAIVCPKGGGGNLLTEQEFSDFVLRLDFKLSKAGNNGIGIRAPFGGDAAYVGNEIQVLDDNEYHDLKYGQNCGSLYRVFQAKKGALKPVGEWNSYEITAQGRHIMVVLNGIKVVDGNINDVTDPEILKIHPGLLRDRGHVGFLGHGDHIEFRNIRIHEFPHFIEHDNTPPAGFKALFNGRDLKGWRGLVGDPISRKKMQIDEWARQQIKADQVMAESWKVDKGTVTYTGKKFDNLCTEKEYGNYELLVDWKVEPKADSGIYVRGCPQIQIWEPNSGSYDKVHPGSGGLFNNQKNQAYPSFSADHYVGEWNRFRIVMVDDKVHVFLNNELVVNNVTLENYWDRKQPLPEYGSIELQAHASKVPFKNIYIREIPRTAKTGEK